MKGKRVALGADAPRLDRGGKHIGRGDTVDGHRQGRVARLRTRERDILRMASAGLDDATIAVWLGAELVTVRRYWRLIYLLLGVTGAGCRQRAVERWQARG